MNYSSEQMRIYMANRRASRRNELRSRLDGLCHRCGTINNLQFDHIDPTTKSFPLSGKYLDYPWAVLLKELDKCQLLCIDCHQKKSNTEQRIRFAAQLIENPRAHGTYSKYRKEHCRCEPCVSNYSAKRRQWRGNALTKVSQGRL